MIVNNVLKSVREIPWLWRWSAMMIEVENCSEEYLQQTVWAHSAIFLEALEEWQIAIAHK